MSLNSSALCPGGTGKPIKFCCKDQVPQLQQLKRMVEGGQNKAALAAADRLLAAQPDRACALAIKALVLRALEQVDAHRAVAETYVAHHPNNPIALAELAMAQAAQNLGREAMHSLQRAIAASTDGIYGRVYEAMDEVAHALLNVGEIIAGRALLSLLANINQEDAHPLEMVLRLNTSPAIPLLLKDEQLSDEIPEGAPAKPAFNAAVDAVVHGLWLSAAEQFAAATAQFPEEPAFWHNLAVVRMWLADTPGAVEAFRKLAALPIPMEDAVEAEAAAMFMAPDPLGDEVDQWRLVYTIADPEQAQIALAGWPRAVALPVDSVSLQRDDQPPPKSVWIVLDRAPVSTGSGEVPLTDLPLILCQAMLYGRQTDRAARLELLGVTEPQRAALDADLRTLFGAVITGEPEVTQLGRTSASRLMVRLARYLPRGISPEQSENVVGRLMEHALLDEWPAHHLGLLDGKTPCEAAAQPEYRTKLLAAILMLQQWLDTAGETFDFNRLRTALGLPTLDPIDPTRTRVERLPLVRLARVDAERLDDETLLKAFRRAFAFGATAAVTRFAQALIDRPQAGTPDERDTAYRLLMQHEKDSQRALALLDRGRKESVAAGRSCAGYDLMELPVRLSRGEVHDLTRLVTHLQREHMGEPGVGQALAQFLMEIGAMRPDGTPAMPAAAPQEQGGLIVPDAVGAEPGKIWTPGDEVGGGKSGKLWTPG